MENRSRRSIASSIAAASQIGSRASNNLNKERLKDLEVPGLVGNLHTIRSSGVLMISGDKGFALFDED